jgi:zinc protease
MSKKQPTGSEKKSTKNQAPVPGYTHITTAAEVEEYTLKSNGLRVLYHHRPDTGVITSNITYLVGARDETRGETGVAHMLEHMLFKPTVHDIKNDIDSASMQFERETGCILNANTWKDRTTYFFSYPKQYLDRALKIEAERMNGTVITDESLAPERNNVLSEFDMNNGDPHFALAAVMCGAAYHSHPYGHETIGYREDIEQYNAVSLERFYRLYYRPDNAIMMMIGDVDRETALKAVKKHFGSIEKPNTVIPRFQIRESKQEGLRRVVVERPSTTQLVSIGVKHAGFPTEDWFVASTLAEVLTSGPESVLHKALVDTGIATSIYGALEPTSEENIGQITVTLAEGQSHETVEKKVLSIIAALDTKTLAPLVKKVKARVLTDELFARDSSLRIAAELTEYVSSGHWISYADTPKILEKITAEKIVAAAKKLFTNSNMTIGYFIGKKN